MVIMHKLFLNKMLQKL